MKITYKGSNPFNALEQATLAADWDEAVTKIAELIHIPADAELTVVTCVCSRPDCEKQPAEHQIFQIISNTVPKSEPEERILKEISNNYSFFYPTWDPKTLTLTLDWDWPDTNLLHTQINFQALGKLALTPPMTSPRRLVKILDELIKPGGKGLGGTEKGDVPFRLTMSHNSDIRSAAALAATLIHHLNLKIETIEIESVTFKPEFQGAYVTLKQEISDDFVKEVSDNLAAAREATKSKLDMRARTWKTGEVTHFELYEHR